MTQRWEIDIPQPAGEEPKLRAVAYYRHSAQDRQQNSIPIQQEQVREWAQKNGVEIIQEFADAGKSGLTAEDRPAFTELMEQWVKQRKDFTYILCLDVSRWGRFQDLDLSAQYSAECKKHGKQVIYTSIGKPREDDPLYPIYLHFERFRAAEFIRELSIKVWRGCAKIAAQGYWAGGPPPYGFHRLLLYEKREPLHTLEAGQRKGIQNQRVTLVEPRSRAREMVHEQIRSHISDVLPYSDFLVLDRRLTISVQPAVPVPHGYAAYWPIQADVRQVIDITLGVLLSDPHDFEILGYVALPRWTGGATTLRLSPTSPRTELFGRIDLAFLKNLL